MKHRLTLALLCLLVAALTCWSYAESLDHGFVDYDDNLYVSENPHLTEPFSGETLRWAFSPYASNWIPLTWLSFALDREIGGLDARVYHRTNLLLHVANGVLLLLAFWRLTGALWPSAFVAAVFAVHPLHVESVAWIAERKDVLSGLFWILTLLAHARYAERPDARRYALVLACLVLGLMAKPMLVTLPFVLLLLDYWPLRRLTDESGRWRGDALRRALFEKVPLLAVALAAAVLTYLVQEEGGAVRRWTDLGFGPRFWNALLAYGSYLEKTLWPVDLAVFYPHPGETVSIPAALAWGGVLVAVTGGTLAWRRSQPQLAVGWLWFVGTLVPVIGLLQVGLQARADRYTYIPQIGLCVAVAWSAAALLRARPAPVLRAAAGVAAAALVVVLAWQTRAQVETWRDGVTLFQHATAVVPKNAIAYFNLGHRHLKRGENDLAFHSFHEAWRADPDWTEPKLSMADIKLERGEFDAARRWIERVLRGAPDDVHALTRLGKLHMEEGHPKLALRPLRRAQAIDPASPEVRALLGSALAAAGNPAAAVAQLRKAVEDAPELALAHGHLGLAIADGGDHAAAVLSYRTALELDPSLADVRANLAVALARLGRDAEALDALRRARADGFDEAGLRQLEATLHFRAERRREGIAALREAVRLDPGLVAARNDLAWHLATAADGSPRDRAAAVRHAETAARATGRRHPQVLDTLATALAAAGRTAEALAVVDEALALAPPGPPPPWVASLRDLRARLTP